MEPAPSGPAEPGANRGLPVWAVAAAALAGMALRIWILQSPFGEVDSDEAVVGLMARHFLRGELDTFFWGQSYGGTLETVLVAAVFAVAGSSVAALKAVPILLTAAACGLTWRVGRVTVGDPAGRLSGALFWVFPPAFVLASTKERGFYGAGLVLCLAILLVALRLDRRPAPAGGFLLGLLAGLGWWTAPHVAFFSLPVLGWLAVRRRREWRLALAFLPGFLIGAAPWIAFNLRNGWPSIAAPEAPPGTYAERVRTFLALAFPAAVGLRMSYSGAWLVGPLGAPLVAGALALVAARRRPLGDPLLLVVAGFPLLLMISAWYLSEPRYAVFIVPVIVLMLARHARPPWAHLLALGVALALTASGLWGLAGWAERHPGNLDLTAGSTAALRRAMEARGAGRAYADYWVSYKLSFESGEQIIATPVDVVRYGPHDALVDAGVAPAYVVLAGSGRDGRLQEALAGLGVPFERVRAGRYAAFFPDRHVRRGELEGVFEEP